MVILVGEKVSEEHIKSAAEDYFGEYIKIVVDVETGAMTSIKPLVNKTHIIEDLKLREIFDNVVKQKFGL